MEVRYFRGISLLYELGLAEGNQAPSKLLYGQALKICSMIDLLGFGFLSF